MSRFLVVAALVLSPVVAFAQYGRPMLPQVEREQVAETGTLKGIGPGVLYVLAEDGGQWMVAVEQNARDIGYTNTAEAGWLRPGMWIEFNAKISSKGEVVSTVNSVNVITPTDKNPPGVHGNEGGSNVSEGLFEGLKEEQPKKPKKNEEVVADFRVVGQLGGTKDGKTQVAAGNVLLKVEFDPETKVAIDVKNLLLARSGDKVEFRGWYVKGNKGKAYANRVVIDGKEPLKMEQTGKKRPMPPMKEKPAEEMKDEKKE